MKSKASKKRNSFTVPRRERVIVALDTRDLAFAKTLVRELKDLIQIFKIGSELFTAHGPRSVRVVREAGREIFLDLKFHDIPNTVAQAVRAAVGLGVSILNVHIPGGAQMMREACRAAQEEARKRNAVPPKLIGVTLLTSLAEGDVRKQIGIPGTIQETVLRFAALAQKSGLNGVVASACEAKAIQAECGSDFLIVTPGIRPERAPSHDQARIVTPRNAFDLGADYIVAGRAVTEAARPRNAVKRMFETL